MTGVGSALPIPGRVFISYAHDSDEHENLVRAFWLFLRGVGVDAKLDLPAGERRQDWPMWMAEQVERSQFILVIASPEYRRRAEGKAPASEGRGVQWEAALLRELVYVDRRASLERVLPVGLPGGSANDIPSWLNPASTTHYPISEFTVPGAEKLLRVLTNQPYETEPPLGPAVSLSPRETAPPAGGQPRIDIAPLSTQVEVELTVTDGQLRSAVTVAGTPVSSRAAELPSLAAQVWRSPRPDPATTEQQLALAGRELASAIFADDTDRLLGRLIDTLRPGSSVQLRFSCDETALAFPLELIRLTGQDGAELEPLALQPGVAVSRQPLGHRGVAEQPSAGPVKVLVAVAAPDESRTANYPLDVEAEMQAVLDATRGLTEQSNADILILEVASLDQITAAVHNEQFHVLHLSAHGSPDGVELEDEDGNPVPVDARDLLGALRTAGRAVPLIVLSSCTGAEGLAGQLVRGGADRVIAMQAPVTDGYATRLAAAFYAALAADPDRSVGALLATARQVCEEQRRQRARAKTATGTSSAAEPVEYAVAALFTAAGDPPLLDPALPPQPLRRPTVAPSGLTVRELPIGRLIGRRAELRAGTAILRRTASAVEEYGATAGVLLTGVGGIGKTALAGRLISRARGDGRPVAVQVGTWDPTQLLAATADALSKDPKYADVVRFLSDQNRDDPGKFELLLQLLNQVPLLLVFDDFEQNLSVGGGWLDPTVEELFGRLANAAVVGSILATCRYPLPGLDGLLVRIQIPPLSPAELGRLLVRLPALRELRGDDRTAVLRTVGGHPRLIEFLDALLRGGKTSLRETGTKLRALAQENQLDLTATRPLGQALDEAVLLGSTDILLADLVGLLTPAQHQLLLQLASCRTPVATDDLAFAITIDPDVDDSEDQPDPRLDEVRSTETDLRRLADLTLITNQQTSSPPSVWTMHPWTAEAVSRTELDLASQHRAAERMHARRFVMRTASYADLLDTPRHFAQLGRFGDATRFAISATRVLPGSLATAAYLADVHTFIPDTERAALVIASLELEAVLATGNLPAAQHLAAASLRQAQNRTDTEPSNTGWQRDLSVSHEKLGDLALAVGELAAATQHYNTALAIRQRLVDADPGNAEWQRDLSVSHNKLGKLARDTGDLTSAAQHYSTALASRQRLADTDPDNTQWQRDLAVSRSNLGDIALVAGDLGDAAQHYNAVLDIAQRLADTDPTNTESQRDLSISRNRLGDLALTAGDFTTAAQHFTADLSIAQQLADTDPTNTEWQRDLSVSHNKLGDLARDTGDLTGATQHYNTDLAIAQRLADSDPTNTEWQRDLSVSHSNLAGLARATGDLTTATQHYNIALTILQQLADTDRSNAQWQRDLAAVQNALTALQDRPPQRRRWLRRLGSRRGESSE